MRPFRTTRIRACDGKAQRRDTRRGSRRSAFMAIRALLRVKPVRRHAKHIVALDANPVDRRLLRLARFWFRGRMPMWF